MNDKWRFVECPCGERFYANKGFRCVKCRAFYWTQFYEGVPPANRVERWEALNVEAMSVLPQVATAQ